MNKKDVFCSMLASRLLAAACANDTPNMPLAGRLEAAAPEVLGPHVVFREPWDGKTCPRCKDNSNPGHILVGDHQLEDCSTVPCNHTHWEPCDHNE